jgi:hypothetical protein
MQLALFEAASYPLLNEELFTAYFDCRRNKRNTYNALAFEKHFEKNIFQLAQDLYSGTYRPGRSMAFIVNKPVKREIFAADFKDRVVHHWLINKLNPMFEKLFIDDSYACRKSKGTLFGIRRLEMFIKECSSQYTQDCYILKLDIKGFFMHINRNLLYSNLERFIRANYKGNDLELFMPILQKVVFNNPVDHCIIKGAICEWEGLPPNKSLFHSPAQCGLPIGNLTSQIFANFYLHALDFYIKENLKVLYYGRYVDDFVLVEHDKVKLKAKIEKIAEFLSCNLGLELHPNKIYLQHYTKGVKFLGAVLKPGRIYLVKRTWGNFYQSIQKFNKITNTNKMSPELDSKFLSCMNSYLGLASHFATYKRRNKMIEENMSVKWLNRFIHNKRKAKFKFRKPAFRMLVVAKPQY